MRSIRPHHSPLRLALLLGVLFCSAPLGPRANAQELGIPAVDDAPSAQLLIEQATDQARANPREAVRLLLEALDGGAERLVRQGTDPDLFASVGARVHMMLAADEALRIAFRREADPAAAELLARGEFARLVETRIDTDAGVEAALRLAQSAMARGRFATAAALLARCAESDLLSGRRALHHAAMRAVALAQLGDGPGASASRALLQQIADAGAGESADDWHREAAPALAAAGGAAQLQAPLAVGGEGYFDAAAPRDWSETWSAPLQPPAVLSQFNIGDRRFSAPGAVRSARATAAPACDAERVYLDDGNGLSAYDRLSGRLAWGRGQESANADASLSTLNYLAVQEGVVVAFTTQPSPLARPGSGRVAWFDAETGAPLGDTRLDRVDGRPDLDGILPQGTPLLVDGRAIVAARRTTPRMETVTWLVALDLEQPRSPAWMRVIATSASARLRASRGSDSPLLAGGVIYLSTATGATTAVDPGDGHIRWLRRSPVPVRDPGNRLEPFETLTPAVAGGRVFAISPDRARVDVLDAASGRSLTAVPLGSDSPLRTPAYLLGDLDSGLVFAVGDSVVCIDAANPTAPRWVWPATSGSAAPAGRVQIARRTGGAPVVVLPTEEATIVLDGATGSEIMRVPGAGDGNPLMAGNQLIVGGSRALASYMPVADAERIARERMASSSAPDAALALLRLAKQVKRTGLAIEAARECLRRAAAVPESAQVRLELLDLLLAVDANNALAGAEGDALSALVDEAARAADRPLRGAIARADRALRRKDARAAASIAAEAALGAEPGVSVTVDGRTASLEAMVNERIAFARAMDARAAEEISSAIERALRDAPRERLATLRRTAARTGAGTRAGAEALLALLTTAAAPESTPAERAAAVRLTRECVAMGASDARFAGAIAALAPDLASECLAAAPAAAPAIAGSAVRIVEFPGRLPRSVPGVAQSLGASVGMLSVQAQELVLRRPPEFAPVWRVGISTRDPAVLAVQPSILLWEEATPGSALATSIDFTGAVRWHSVPAAELFSGVGADFAEDAPSVDLGDGRSVSSVQMLPLPTATSLVVARRDGALAAIGLSDGRARWQRRAAMQSVAAAARGPFAVALAGEGTASDAGPVRVEAIEPASGEAFLAWSPADASEVRWLRLERSGLLVVATDAGIEARRTAGGDESAPFWRVDDPDARATVRGWSAGNWIVALDRFNGLLAIDARTGAVNPLAFQTPASGTLSPVREIFEGDSWIALVRDERIDFFDLQGRFLGRDAPTVDRDYMLATGARSRIFALDSGRLRNDLAEGRFPALLHDLDPAAGGFAVTAPLRLSTVGQPISSIAAMDGWVFVSNGSVVQAIDMHGPAPVLGTPSR